VEQKVRAATIFYMTGTGNTRRATEVIKERLEAAGWGVTAHEIRNGAIRPSANPEGSLLVLAFPVLGFGMPVLVRKVLRGLKGRPARAVPATAGTKRAARTPAAVFATWGGAPSASLWQACRFLKRKGFSVIAAGGATYPFNWTQVIQPPDAREADAVLAEGDKAAAAFANLLLPRPRAHPIRSARITALLNLPGAFIYSAIGRFGLAGIFSADTQCTACGACVRGCPAKAIALRGDGLNRRPRWTSDCQGCNRCINLCPKSAIQSSPLRAIVHIGVNVGLVVALAIGLSRLSAAARLPQWLSVPAWIALFIVGTVYLSRLQFAALEPLLFRLESIPAFRRLAGRSWTVGFRRYKAPPRLTRGG
jgi:Pyruvate/2-oxoacid:ferredoxin oxidoreductase delta subunit